MEPRQKYEEREVLPVEASPITTDFISWVDMREGGGGSGGVWAQEGGRDILLFVKRDGGYVRYKGGFIRDRYAWAKSPDQMA